MTNNLMFLFCLVAIISNQLVAISDARDLKNPSDEKEMMMGGEKGGGGGAYEADLMKNYEIYYKNQLPIPIPFPLPVPFPRIFPFPPFFPPVNIPGIVARPNPLVPTAQIPPVNNPAVNPVPLPTPPLP